ncbi:MULTISPECIES: helix-turn-helix domain-containing protein [Glaesserella]|uniref:Transcriptional regulator n=1 Tax=Glaesserella australis TaxID=2094024 RepID=A0A328C059_9PAST|nr:MULTISPECIES: helix-turn-helix transcriptional regulator [Glaesserella]AUI66895.1 transcriptional regulator [Glaesserella sp. 15-184]RAL19946.1 transcriptional regulator [Glaesserella australis]
MNINIEIGRLIRIARKKSGLTLVEFSKLVYKNPSTLSKYEKGEIVLDIPTLYHIAQVLNIDIEQLLIRPHRELKTSLTAKVPTFFMGLSQFYAYFYDGRNNSIVPCVVDLISQLEENRFKVVMYMNYKDFNNYQECENTYTGYIEHFDAVTNIILINKHMPMEKPSIQILASQLEADRKWGLWTGFSTRPMMPVSMKMLFSRIRLSEDTELLNQLRISKEDIKLYRLYNMFMVI